MTLQTSLQFPAVWAVILLFACACVNVQENSPGKIQSLYWSLPNIFTTSVYPKVAFTGPWTHITMMIDLLYCACNHMFYKPTMTADSISEIYDFNAFNSAICIINSKMDF